MQRSRDSVELKYVTWTLSESLAQTSTSAKWLKCFHLVTLIVSGYLDNIFDCIAHKKTGFLFLKRLWTILFCNVMKLCQLTWWYINRPIWTTCMVVQSLHTSFLSCQVCTNSVKHAFFCSWQVSRSIYFTSSKKQKMEILYKEIWRLATGLFALAVIDLALMFCSPMLSFTCKCHSMIF